MIIIIIIIIITITISDLRWHWFECVAVEQVLALRYCR